MRLLDRRDIDMAVWEQLDVQSPLYTYALQWPRFASRCIFPTLTTTGGFRTLLIAWMHS